MEHQHSHRTTTFLEKQHPIVIIGDGVSGPANIGGLLRLGDAFGVEQLVFGNAIIDFSTPRLRRAARHTHTNIPHGAIDHLISFIFELKENGYHILGLEITSNSKPIQQLENLKGTKIALVIGNEQHGISSEVLAAVNETAHIEMFGINSSMNVTQATAIALFELTKS